MRASTIATLAVALVATAEASRPQPYMVARAPFASLLGIARRNTGGYSPETELCGDGDTCSEACGSGYETCISADKNNHCFNPAAGDSCCSIQSGESCETGYYCSHDSYKNTICCPDALDLAACAAALSPDSPLTSDAASSASASATASHSSTKVPASHDSAEKTTTSAEAAVTTSSAAAEDDVTTHEFATHVTTSSGFAVTSSVVVKTSSAVIKTTSTKTTESEPTDTSVTGNAPAASDSDIPDSAASRNGVAFGLVGALFVAFI